MKEVLIGNGPTATIVESPVPKPGAGQTVIRVMACGSNPKDWKSAEWFPDQPPLNQGDDISGFVHEVGEGVFEFRKGDRVAAFHEMKAPGGGYAEFAVSWASTTFKLPESTTFEEGAAIPLAALTAAVGLYDRLELPEPWRPAPAGTVTPLIIYGAASAVGSYSVQLARRSGLHPLICIAGRGKDHVENLIDRSKGDTIVDYRDGDEAVVSGINDALKGEPARYAFDAVSEHGSYENIGRVLDPNGRIAMVLPAQQGKLPETVKAILTTVGSVHGNPELWDFGYVYCRYFSKGLSDGFFKAQPQVVVPGGLHGVESALRKLKEGSGSAVKYIVRIGDTPGLSRDSA